MTAYRLLHPDLEKLPDASLLEHYEQHGIFEGRSPTALFDPVYYAGQAGVSVQNAYEQHRSSDRNEHNPHPLFDVAFYSGQAGHTADPVRHYIEDGWKLGFDPHPLFSTKHYLSQSHGILSSGRDPLTDFILYGWQQGRNPNSLFDADYYLANSPDVRATGLNALTHYVTLGWREHRSHHPLFDGVYYATQLGENKEPLSHYLHEGHQDGYNPHPLFVTDYYLVHSPDVIGSEVNPLAHFWRFGGAELRPHHPLFDPRWYQDRTSCSGTPLLHYLDTRGRHDPGPLFNTRWYLDHVPAARQGDAAPLVHWVVEGACGGHAFSSLPLDELVLDMMSEGDVVGAATMLRLRLNAPDGSSRRRVALPFTIDAHDGRVDEGYVIGGLPGVITTEGKYIGAAPVNRPRVIQQSGNVAILRSADGMALVDHSPQTVDHAVMVADDVDGDAWDWCARRLPALSALTGSERIVISRQLDAPTLALTRHVLANRDVTFVEPGSALRVSGSRVIPEALPHDHHRLAPGASADGVLLILDERDPFDDMARTALVSAVNRVGGLVIDTSWGIPLIEESISTCTRLIASAAVPVVSYLARRGSTIVALIDHESGDDLGAIRSTGLTVELVVLPVAEPPIDQHSPTLLDPRPELESILGRAT